MLSFTGFNLAIPNFDILAQHPYYVVDSIEIRVREVDAGDAPHGEHQDEADRPQHRGAEFDRAAPHGGEPREHLDAGRYRDHHGGDHEIGLGVDADAGREHVMGPNDKAKHNDRHHGVDHAEIT